MDIRGFEEFIIFATVFVFTPRHKIMNIFRKIWQKPFKTSFTKNILLIILILAVGYFAVTLYLHIVTRHDKVLQVPDMTGLTLTEAQAVAAEHELRLEVTDSVYIRGMERGVISRQNPTPGSKVKKNRRILLVINSVMPRQSIMPSLTGYSLRQAKTELIANGLKVGRLIYQTDLATNNVLAQQFHGADIRPGTRLDSGSSIDLVLGLNPKDSAAYIPNVIGYRYQLATDILIENSLNIDACHFDNTVSDYADTLAAYVYGQYPPASDSISVTIGSYVTLYLSKDVSKIPVPDADSTATL